MTLSVETHNTRETIRRPGQRPVLREIRYDPSERLGVPNTIELRAKDVPESAGGADHLFWVYTNDAGLQYYLSGYPGEGDREGELVLRGYDYVRDTPDYVPYTVLATISADSPQEAFQAYKSMQRDAIALDAAAIPYLLRRPPGFQNPNQNSNSFAMTLGRNLFQREGLDFDTFYRRVEAQGNYQGSGNDLNRFLSQQRSQIENESTPIQEVASIGDSDFQTSTNFAPPSVPPSTLSGISGPVDLDPETGQYRSREFEFSDTEIKILSSALRAIEHEGGPIRASSLLLGHDPESGDLVGFHSDTGDLKLVLSASGELTNHLTHSEQEAVNYDLSQLVRIIELRDQDSSSHEQVA